MNEKKIPLLHSHWPLVDLVTPIRFLFTPENLFNQAKKLNPEIFSFRMAAEPWIFLTGKEGLHYFAHLTINEVDPFEYRKRMYTLNLPGISLPNDLPNATLATNAILKKYFEKMNEAELVQIFTQEATDYINHHLKENGTIDNLVHFIIKLSTQVFGVIFFGKALFETLPKDLGDIYATIDSTLTIPPLIFPFLPKKNRKIERPAKEKLVTYLRKLIREEKQNSTLDLTPNLISGYINLESILGLSEDNIIWLFNAMLWAAIHYSGVHGIWTAIEILTRPKLLADLEGEQSKFNNLNFESIKKMWLLEGTIRESIRLNSLFALPRRVLKDIYFKDYKIAKGTIISISPFLEHQNADVYINPDKFDPFRWDEWADQTMYESFMPGGIGYFGCKGMPIALQFLTTLWAIMLRNYEFELVSRPPIMRKQQVLLAPSMPVALRYRKR